jgi:hypothetical protein
VKRFNKPNVLLASAMLLLPGTGFARDAVEVNFNAAVREYCHVLRFPLGWQMVKFVQDEHGKQHFVGQYDLSGNYEFRIPGVLSTKFLVRGTTEVVRKYYTTNVYEADFSDPSGVAQPATEDAWNSSTPIALYRSTLRDVKIPPPPPPADPTLRNTNPTYVEFHGFRFTRSGDHWEGASLSPARDVLVMQSWSGKLGNQGNDAPLNIPLTFTIDRNHGKFYFDAYNADTGKKVITITASFVSIRPGEVFGKTGWVTERYLIVPLDERREHCLVCDFGRGRR